MSQAVSQAESNAETWCLQVPASEARRGEELILTGRVSDREPN